MKLIRGQKTHCVLISHVISNEINGQIHKRGKCKHAGVSIDAILCFLPPRVSLVISLFHKELSELVDFVPLKSRYYRVQTNFINGSLL